MADAPRADGFEWGFTALPAVEEGGERASYSFFEQIWICLLYTSRAFVFDNCLAFGYGNLSVYGSGTPAESEKQQIPQNDSCDCLRIFRRYGDLSGRLGKYCSHVCILDVYKRQEQDRISARREWRS